MSGRRPPRRAAPPAPPRAGTRCRPRRAPAPRTPPSRRRRRPRSAPRTRTTSGRPHRRHGVARADELEPHAVASRVLSRAVDDDRHPVVHLQDDRRRVDVAMAGEALEDADGARGERARHLAPGEPAREVEVVDVHVAEDPAARRDEVLGRRARVVHRDPQGAQRPQPPGDRRLTRGLDGGVEAPLEAHLHGHAGLAQQLDGRARVGHGQRDRLLAQHGDAAQARARLELVAVLRRRRGDDDPVGPARQRVAHRRGAGAGGVRGGPRPGGVAARQDHLADLRLPGQGRRAQAPHAPGAQHRDPHVAAATGRPAGRA